MHTNTEARDYAAIAGAHAVQRGDAVAAPSRDTEGAMHITVTRIVASCAATRCVPAHWPGYRAPSEHGPTVDCDDPAIDRVQASVLRRRAAFAAIAGVESVAS